MLISTAIEFANPGDVVAVTWLKVIVSGAWKIPKSIPAMDPARKAKIIPPKPRSQKALPTTTQNPAITNPHPNIP